MKDIHALLLIAFLVGCFFAALTVFNKIVDMHGNEQKRKQLLAWKEKHVAHNAL